MVSRKLLYLVSFVGLAAAGALAIDRIGTPSMASALLLAVVVATLAGAPGLVHRRAWPLSLVLIPLGAYIVMRAQMHPSLAVSGLWEQLGFYREQLRDGAEAYVTQRLPFNLAKSAELRLLLVVVVYSATALAAFVALGLRKALPAIVVFLVVLGFGLTIDDTDRVLWLPLAFLLLAGCLLMLSRSLGRERWKPTDSLAGVATTVLASLLALSLLGATSAAAGQPWQDWRTWGGPNITRNNTNVVFNWMEDYPGLLDPARDAQVMLVKSPVASYWRANALDYFNGVSWYSSASSRSQLVADPRYSSYTFSVPSLSAEPPGKLVAEVFQLTSMYTDHFLVGGKPRTLVLTQDLPVNINSTEALGIDGPLGPKLSYQVKAVIPRLKPADLVGRGRFYPEDVLSYLIMPFPTLGDLGQGVSETDWRRAVGVTPGAREWSGLYQLNRRMIGAATDPYQIALRIEEYLRAKYLYSLTPPRSSDRSPYAAFLFQTRTGFCQHFAGAMAALLRFNGIPARVAVGFTAGRQIKDGTFVVRRTDAHAWVEAYFPQVGWVPFDPTPGRSLPGPGVSSTSSGFVSPFSRGGSGEGQDQSQAAAGNNKSPRRDSGAAGGAGAGVSAGPSKGRGLLLLAIAVAVLLVAWPLVRVTLRRVAVRRGGPYERLRASLALLYRELGDYGVEVPRSQTLEETSRLLRERLEMETAGLVDRVQAFLFGGRRPTERDLDDVTELRRDLRRKLRARVGWRRGLFALYGLPAPLASARTKGV
jgi:Transglutaminase-like superfamily/TgpA N-terminal domain